MVHRYRPVLKPFTGFASVAFIIVIWLTVIRAMINEQKIAEAKTGA